MIKMSIFRKMIYALCLLVVPIVAMYGFSMKTSTGVVEEQIHQSNLNRLKYFANQIDSQIKQMTISAIALTQDPNVQQFMGYTFHIDSFENARNKAAIIQKLKLFSLSLGWPVQISISSNVAQEVISNDPAKIFDDSVLRKNVKASWTSLTDTKAGHGTDFYNYALLPEYKNENDLANLAVELHFSDQSLMDLLDNFKQESIDEPMLYRKGGERIVNRSANSYLIGTLTEFIGKERPLVQDNGTFNAELSGQSYEITYMKIPSLQWYALNIAPIEKIIKPIYKSRDLFLYFIMIITILGFVSAFLVYRQVQIPLARLIRSLKKIQTGDYSVRLQTGKRDEFQFLYQSFNEMAERIQELIENVFSEKLQSREAKLKHLQSQINPHFIYNSMGFIINMSKLKHQDAVISMAQNLSQFYRYTTRLEKSRATLKEELDLIVNYLEIHRLRSERVTYEIDVPDVLLKIEVPRLLLQPIVENAIIHGIHNKLQSGYICIQGKIRNDKVWITIEDDGIGVTEAELNELNLEMKLPMQEETGCGLWNVNQRIKLHFGDQAGVELSKSGLGGLRVVLFWSIKSSQPL